MKTKQADWPYELITRLVPDVTGDAYDAVWSYLVSPSAYFFSLPMNSWRWRNADEQLILECVLYGWDWTAINSVNCTREPVLQATWDPDYHHCYKIQIPDDSKQASFVYTRLVNETRTQ